MKVFYKTILKSEPKLDGSIRHFEMYEELEDMTPCCPSMGKALDARAIRFGEFDEYQSSDNHLNFSHCYPYPEGAMWDEYPISFCPFCGEKVETEEKQRVRRKYLTEKVLREVGEWIEEPAED